MFFPSMEKNEYILLKEKTVKKENISLFNYPQLLHLLHPTHGREEKRWRGGGQMLFSSMASPSPSNSLSNVLAATFMHETQKWIESIQWAFRH